MKTKRKGVHMRFRESTHDSWEKQKLWTINKKQIKWKFITNATSTNLWGELKRLHLFRKQSKTKFYNGCVWRNVTRKFHDVIIILESCLDLITSNTLSSAIFQCALLQWLPLFMSTLLGLTGILYTLQRCLQHQEFKYWV